MLCVFNLWKVKTLQFQLTTNQKKRKLGENLYTEEVDEDEPCQHNVESYLDRLYTLLLAYAIAGVASPPGTTPDATKESTLGADSTEFAAVPIGFEQRGRATRCTLLNGWHGYKHEEEGG